MTAKYDLSWVIVHPGLHWRHDPMRDADCRSHRNRTTDAGQLVLGLLACRVFQLHHMLVQFKLGGFHKNPTQPDLHLSVLPNAP